MKKIGLLAICALVLGACSNNVTYTEKENPANAYKDYRGNDKTVLGVGKTISQRKSEANATISFKSKYSVEEAINKYAKKYSLSVEWEDEVDKFAEKRLTATKQTFNEARAYLEDVYGVSIIRIRDRAIKVMVPATVSKIESFNPGPNVRLSEAVNGLASICDINLVIADYKKVLSTEKITTNLQNISCKQAFEAILDPFGLSLKSRGTHYTIAGLPYKEWQLDLHEQKREESQEVNYSSEFSGGGDDADSGSVISGGKSSTRQTYSRDLWKGLEDDLKELLDQSCKNSKDLGYTGGSEIPASLPDPITGQVSGGSMESASSASTQKPCGYVRVNADIGVVQMQAPRKVIEKADDMIHTLEEIASRRLLVEARILAVSKTRSFNRGADVSVSGNVGSTDFSLGFNPTTPLSGSNSSVAGTLSTLLSTTDGALTGGGLGFKAGDLDAVVRYVESFGTTYALMKPTLEVMDRQKATLIDGRNEKYFLKTGEIDNSGDTPVVTTDLEEKIQFVGIQFSVSAQIAENEDDLHTISLQIPITDILRYEDEDILLGTETLPIRVPIASTRVIDQKVRARDGEIKVIGGLTKTIAVDKETGVPLLKDVPVAGNAFSEESVTYEDVEFVVLLQVKKLD